jgi:nucleotide-binding universal stress UspA family protein
MTTTTTGKLAVPFDLTSEAFCAFEHACNIAKKTGGSVTTITLLNSSLRDKLKKEGSNIADLNLKLAKITEEAAANHGIGVSYIIEDSNDLMQIGKLANELESDLLVFGTHGVVGKQIIFGANALKVSAGSNCPDLIVQNKKPNPVGYKNIVIPIGARTEEKIKIQFAIVIAKIYDGTLHFVCDKESDSFLSKQVEHNLQFMQSEAESAGISYTSAYADNDNITFVRQVVRYGARNNADLIVFLNDGSKSLFGLSDIEVLINNDAEIPCLSISPMETKVGGFHYSTSGI